MGLKIRFEFACCRDQCEGEFFHGKVSFFGIAKCPASVIHGLLHSFFFSDQGGANGGRGDGQIEEKLLTELRGT